MSCIDNFCNTTFSVENAKDNWSKDNYLSIANNLKKQQREISKGTKRTCDEIKKDINNIDQGSSNIQNIDNAVEQLLKSAKEEPFPSLDFQINDTGTAKTMTRIHKPTATKPKKLTEAEPKKLTEAEPKKLIPIRIVAFCGKLLDIIKYNNLPFQNARDKYKYLQKYFEVKKKIAEMQNILLVRWICSVHKTKSEEAPKKDNNKNKNPRTSPEEFTKTQINLFIKANYLAFKSSMQEYEQLRKEIKDIDQKLTQEEKTNINKLLNECQNIHTGKKNKNNIKDNEKDKAGKDLPENPTLNENTIIDILTYKKTIKDNEKQLLTKLLEKCILINGIRERIRNFVSVFSASDQQNNEIQEKEGEQDEKKSNLVKNMDKPSCEFDKDKSEISSFLNESLSMYLNKIKNTIKNNHHFKQEYKFLDDIFHDDNKHDNMEKEKSYASGSTSDYTGGLCCSVCADDFITYSNKEINSRENIDDILNKYQPTTNNIFNYTGINKNKLTDPKKCVFNISNLNQYTLREIDNNEFNSIKEKITENMKENIQDDDQEEKMIFNLSAEQEGMKEK